MTIDECKTKAKAKELRDRIYNQGMNAAWACAKRIILDSLNDGLSQLELRKIFDTDVVSSIFINNTAQEAVEKIMTWEEKQIDNEIKVGDEVYILDKNYPYVVTNVDIVTKTAVFFAQSGKWGAENISKLHKTGRHFPEISEVLKQMRGEE